MTDQSIDPTANEILNDQVIYVKRGRLNRFGFEPAWNAYFDFYLSSKYLEKPILQLEDVTFHLWLRKNLNDDDPNWQMPSIRVMKRKFGIGQNRIDAMLDRLTKAHLLKKVSGLGSGEKGANVTNTYELSDPIQHLDDFLTVAKAGGFSQPLKAGWLKAIETPVPETGTGAVPELGTPPVPETGTHKHTSSFKQTSFKQTTVAAPKRKDKNNNSSGKPDEKESVVVALIEKGISKRVANRLASRYNQTRVLEKIAFLEYLQEIDSEKVKSPAGYLRRAIEEDYAAPAGYTKDWRDREAAEAEAREQARQEKERQEAARAAREAEERAQREKTHQEQLTAARAHYSTSEKELETWSNTLNQLAASDPTGVKTFFAGSELLSLAEGQAVIWLPRQYAKQQVESRYTLALQRLLARPLGVSFQDVRLIFVIPESSNSDTGTDNEKPL